MLEADLSAGLVCAQQAYKDCLLSWMVKKGKEGELFLSFTVLCSALLCVCV